MAGAGAGGAGAGAATQPSMDRPIVGASLKVTMASDRSVSLTETFDRPLVIGFLAFDLPILDNGTLGAPVSTQAQLEQRNPEKGRQVRFQPDRNSAALRAWLRQDPENRRKFNEFVATAHPQLRPDPAHGGSDLRR